MTWLVVAALLAGIGVLAARGLAALAGARTEPRLPIALWLGLATLVAYLQLWNLALPVDWRSWPAPIALGCLGVLLRLRRLRPRRPSPRAVLICAFCAVAGLWFANQALGPAEDYDFFLYHLNIIEYAERYATIPGLGDLHVRLGAGDAQLLLAALLDHGPWAGAGSHLVLGLFVLLLLVEVGSRVARAASGPPSFTRRVAVLVLAGTVVLTLLSPEQAVASPNLDFGAFVLVSVGMVYIADCVEHGPRLLEACVGVGILAVASSTRPLYWTMTLVALVVLALTGRGLWSRHGRFARAAAGVGALPALLALGWMARQALLSGYPLFPLTVAGLPVDWRIPVSVVATANRGNDAWARWPGMPPAEVFSSWRWLTANWLKAEKIDLAVLAPLMLLAGVIPALGAGRDAGRRARTRPLLAVLVPSLVALAVWFHVAPDPRFAWAPIWLVPIAVVAWSLPPLSGWRAGIAAVGTGVVAGSTVAVLLVDNVEWLLPTLIGLWAYLYLIALLLRLRRFGTVLAHAATVSAVVVSAYVAGNRGLWTPIHADGPGPFGAWFALQPTPQYAVVETDSGLRVQMPIGTDQCFAALLCTPQVISDHLHERGRGVSSGFSVGG